MMQTRVVSPPLKLAAAMTLGWDELMSQDSSGQNDAWNTKMIDRHSYPEFRDGGAR